MNVISYPISETWCLHIRFLQVHPRKTNMTMEKITCFNRRYIFNGCFYIDMLVFRGVVKELYHSSKIICQYAISIEFTCLFFPLWSQDTRRAYPITFPEVLLEVAGKFEGVLFRKKNLGSKMKGWKPGVSIPKDPCMVYLPAFSWFSWYM